MSKTRGSRALERVLAGFQDKKPAWAVYSITASGSQKLKVIEAEDLKSAMRKVSGSSSYKGRAKVRAEGDVGTMLWRDSKVMLELVPVSMSAAYEGEVVSAAKDNGDNKGDKSRLAGLGDLIDRAQSLQEMVDLDVFPEAKTALDAVASLSTIVTKVGDAQTALKNAPSKTEEAEEAQAELDKVRSVVDSMIPPVKATLDALETLLRASMELEEQFAGIKRQAAVIEKKCNEQKERISKIAEAVKHAANM